MRTILAALAAALLFSQVAFASGGVSKTAASFGPVKTAALMPTFAGYSLDGEFVRSKALTENGGGVIVSFFATYCGPCKVGMPIIEQEVAKNEKWKVVFVNVGEEEAKVKQMLSSMGLKSTVVMDTHGTIGKRFGVGDSLPKTFIVGPSGKVGTIFVEEGDDLQPLLEKAITTAK